MGFMSKLMDKAEKMLAQKLQEQQQLQAQGGAGGYAAPNVYQQQVPQPHQQQQQQFFDAPPGGPQYFEAPSGSAAASGPGRKKAVLVSERVPCFADASFCTGPCMHAWCKDMGEYDSCCCW
jgi:hypothetical protein